MKRTLVILFAAAVVGAFAGASFFTLVFPLVLLALLNSTGRGNTVSVPGGKVDFAQYFTPSIGVYALAVSCYVTPIFGLANARELGILKRVPARR